MEPVLLVLGKAARPPGDTPGIPGAAVPPQSHWPQLFLLQNSQSRLGWEVLAPLGVAWQQMKGDKSCLLACDHEAGQSPRALGEC